MSFLKISDPVKLGLLKYSNDFSKTKGLNQLWYKDTSTQARPQNTGWNIRKQYITDNSDPKGSFSFRIPLKHILGFVRTMIG